jgi:hypothetical protein
VTVAGNLADAAQMLRAERDENVVREDFTPSEAVAIARQLEPVEREEAKDREAAGRGRPKKGEKFTPISNGEKSMDKVAAAVGLSRPTLKKSMEVVEEAENDPATFGPIADLMDETGSIDGAHKKLKRKRRELERQRQVEQGREMAAPAGVELWCGDMRIEEPSPPALNQQPAFYRRGRDRAAAGGRGEGAHERRRRR